MGLKKGHGKYLNDNGTGHVAGISRESEWGMNRRIEEGRGNESGRQVLYKRLGSIT